MGKLEDIKKFEDNLEDLFARIGPQIHMKTNSCSTYKVFTELDNLITELELESFTSSYREEKEFLFDFCWKEEKDGTIIDIPLVCECEWDGISHIKYDFSKLLLAKSEYKLMIFQANDKHQANSIMNELKKIVDGFKSMCKQDKEDKEYYFLFCFLNSGTTENHEYFLFAKYFKNGKLESKICKQKNTNGGTI
ncbi:hypothetical protein [Treponema putidum]|uniref:hypothetical protein n=1 Tax=Treponema putidum TaxID=221027 RepID=UPI002106AB17|nr:hypothetical protein [Treponema putidum]UTY30987.1 hypothetical protein E4N75_05175 [Treponema putidum]